MSVTAFSAVVAGRSHLSRADYSLLHPPPPPRRDLPSVPDKVKHLPLGGKQASACAGRRIRVVDGEGQGLHNELENVSYIAPHLSSRFFHHREQG